MKPERKPVSDETLDEQILQSMLRNGSAFPMTKEEVKSAKASLIRGASPIPAHLRDASEVLRRIQGGGIASGNNVVQLPPNAFAEVKHELARAARHGKAAISGAVDERMRENRERMRQSHG